jgi:menaquinone-dependent protoporphyrinogen oxidase
MTRRILVAHATAPGSPQEVAAAVADALREGGAQVDLHTVEEVRDLIGDDTLVLGSALRGGQVLPEALRFARFAQRHAAALGAVPVAYFVVCATRQEDPAAHRQAVARSLEPRRQTEEAAREALFAGRIDHRPRNPLRRWAMRLTVRLMQQREGDWRAWTKIRAWAAALAPRPARPAPAPVPVPAPVPTPAA